MNTIWPSGTTNCTFYIPHNPVRGIENSVIDFDIENMRSVLPEQYKSNAENVANRMAIHYNNTRMHEKRAYGDRRVDDFQRYNWGISLTVEMGLWSDQTELLMSLYTRVVDNRIIEKEYELMLILHTTFKHIRKQSKKSKWRDLKTSWKLNAKKLPHVPLSISKKQFIRILNVNNLEFDINMEKVSRDMALFDYEADYMHSLLVDDPLLRGSLPPPRKPISCFPKSKNASDEHSDTSNEFISEFKRRMEQEAVSYTKERERTLALEKEFKTKDVEAELHEIRRMESEMLRRELLEQSTDELSMRVLEIKKERQMEKEREEQLARQAARDDLLQKTKSLPALERSVSKLHIPIDARSMSHRIKTARSESIGPKSPTLERCASTTAVKVDEEVGKVDTAVKRKRRESRMPRSSSVDTEGLSHLKPTFPDPSSDIILAPLHKAGEGDFDEFAAALLAEENENAQSCPWEAPCDADPTPVVGGSSLDIEDADNAPILVGADTTDSSKDINTIEAPIADANTYSDSNQSAYLSSHTESNVVTTDAATCPSDYSEDPYTGETGVQLVDNVAESVYDTTTAQTRTDDIATELAQTFETERPGMDVNNEENVDNDDESIGFLYDGNDDEEYYVDEMSEVSADIVTDVVGDLFIDSLLSTISADELSSSPSPHPSARLSARSTTSQSMQNEYDFEYEDTVLETVMELYMDSVVGDMILAAVVKESLVIAEYTDSARERPLSSAGNVDASLSLELQRLERFKAVQEKKQLDALPSPVMFNISEDVEQPTHFPSLSDIFQLPYEDFLFNVPKTNNLLRILIRHDDDGEYSGLFIHGFKSYSRAEEQGLLRVGDEVLEVNDIDVKGQQLEAVISALVDHNDEFVRILIRRRKELTSNLSPRSNWSPRSKPASTKSSPRAFIISEHASQPEVFPDFSDLLKLPAQDMTFRVPKTNNQLRVQLRHDDDGEFHGVFVHGFRPFSKAETQGLLKVGDELLEVDGVDVSGGSLEDVVAVLVNNKDDYVTMLIRRRDELSELLKYAPYFSPRGGSDSTSPRGAQDGLDAIINMQWDDIAIDSQSSEELRIGESGFSVTSSLGSGISGEITDLVDEASAASGSPRVENVTDDIDITVPRTDGALRVLIKNINGTTGQGFYVHGFKPVCKADGILKAGDVLLEINGSSVHGLTLNNIATMLAECPGDSVPMKIRRTYTIRQKEK